MTTQVLICDDSSMARKLLARTLPDDWDVEISFAGHGEEALAQIKAGKGDVLFLDLNMPVMDGYRTLEEIKKQDLPTLTIVVSGDVQPDAYKRVMALGAIDFIKKPTSTGILLELLERSGLYSAAVNRESQPDTRERSEPVVHKHELVEINTLDYMQEITNVSMGQAADLLARLLDVFIKLPVPKVNLIEMSELQMALAYSERNGQYSAISQGFVGAGIAGEALLMFSDSSFHEIAKLFHYKDTLSRSEELELLMELASILIGASTAGIAKQMDISFSQGHPVVMGQHVKVGELIRSNTHIGKQIMAIELSYEIESYDIQCDLLLLFTEDSLEALNRRLSYCLH